MCLLFCFELYFYFSREFRSTNERSCSKWVDDDKKYNVASAGTHLLLLLCIIDVIIAQVDMYGLLTAYP